MFIIWDITKKTDELSFLKPQNNYALSKFEQESLIRILPNKQYQVCFIQIRICIWK